MNNTSDAKPQKAKGPFRTGALVPSLILLAIIYGYFYFFFDHHLRRGIEFAASRLYGAEVNVGSVKTSFLHASFRLNDLEVTDKEKPERNLVQVGDIHFAALWDALLRGKVAISDASVLDIRPYTQRSHPGFILPPPPPSKSLLSKVQDQVIQQTRSQFNENFLGDIADVVAGSDPKAQLKEIEGSLKAEARAKQLEAELTGKQAEWQKRIADLPKSKDIDDISAKIKALSSGSKNPLEIAQNARKIKDLLGEAQSKLKQVEETQGKLTSDLQNYSHATQDLQNLVQQDVADLQKRLKIPSIDPKEFSRQLFMAQLEKRIVGVRKYIEIARKYMPAKKTPEQIAAEKKRKEEEQLLPPARGEGRTYRFPITKGYPLFWLKRAAVSSELHQSEWAGKVTGEILDVTSSPAELGRPTQVHLAGAFPKQGIHGFDFLATLDHVTEKAKDSVKMKVAALPVANQMFTDSPSVKLGLKSAQAAAELSAVLVEQTVEMSLGSRFEKAEFDFDAKQPQVKEILGAVLKSIPVVTMNAKVTGSWDHFNINIDSNLGSELSHGFERQLQAKLGEAKAKLTGLVNEKVGPAKKKVDELLGKLSSGPGKALSQNKGELDKAIKGAQGSATKGSSPAGNLLKGFGF